MSEINYISELTGTGKTGAILNDISSKDGKYIIAVPNKSLCKEIYTRLVSRNINEGVTIINSDTNENPSVLLGNKIKNPRNTNIIITTHMSFMLCIKDGLLEKAKKWKLIIDEELMFYKNHEINVSEYSQDIINETIRLVDYDDTFYKITAKDRLLWNDIIIGQCNETFLNHEEYVDLVKLSSTNVYTTFIPKESFHKFMDDPVDIKKRQFKKFYAISICNKKFFESFNEVTIICSFFEKTISYKLMKWMGLNLKKKSIPNVYTQHPNSEYITINYYCKSNWSNILKSRSVKEFNISLEEHIKEKILLDMKDGDFIYNTNVNFRKRFNSSKGKLVTSTHGVNKYINYTNMVFMPSLNATASLVNVLSYFGLKRKEIDFSRNVLNAYQFLSRGAIRKSDNKENIKIYVMDERTMLFLKSVFPKAQIQYHDAESMIHINKENKTQNAKAIPNNIRSFISRVRKRLEKGEHIREKTIKKYQEYIDYYY